MKKVMVLIALMSMSAMANAAIGFLISERISGINKICLYKVQGNDVSITIDGSTRCPLTINQ
jgi:hypothetical protein